MAKSQEQTKSKSGEFVRNIGMLALFIGAIAVGAEVLHGALVTH